VNRTDRLYALAEELRAHAPRLVAARHLAERFEVSVRTIERDLLALQQAGVPIWTQPGPGGGYALDPLTTLPPLNLTPAEATAIATALAAGGPFPFAEAGRSALRKLAAAMSEAQRDAAGVLLERVAIADGADSPDGASRANSPAASAVARTVEEAVAAGVAVDIEYEDKADQRTSRVVEPSGLLRGVYGWYLVGWCRLRQDGRAFRLDRILHARLTEERVAARPLEEMVAGIPRAIRHPALT
jgi:predicted DNA-binding transcriptional regulator YafY